MQCFVVFIVNFTFHCGCDDNDRLLSFFGLQDASVREVSLVTLRHIAEALHPNRITFHIILESRSEILNQTLHQLRPQYSNIGVNSRRLELYPVVLHVAKALMYPSENCNRKIFSMVHHIGQLTYQFLFT